MAFRFGSPEHDVLLLREVVQLKPFLRPIGSQEGAWRDVAVSLNHLGMAANPRTCRDRTKKLLNNEMNEANVERQRLLQEVMKDFQGADASHGKKAGKRSREASRRAPNRTMRSIPLPMGANALDTDDSTLGSPPPAKRHADAEYREEKKREEFLSLAVMRELLTAERKERERKEALDREERAARAIADREDKHEMMEMMKMMKKLFQTVHAIVTVESKGMRPRWGREGGGGD
ncbi:unnamed protein product [Darwinula stevensoni]|uniref:Uncharacterized protein n=1 Tax=Darwinula stevensoni TaxID=69355 RepID=A0A7R9AHD7_9CRUS|nr:unnamed protein product [Darwinula stevensoni]CAG0904826.1 unnamed protein product [Darwinula stevensoni]